MLDKEMQWECSPTESALDLGYGKFKRLWFVLRDNQIVNVETK